MADRSPAPPVGPRRPPARPSAFDVQFDAHRAAVLRRRLAAYCVAALLPYAVLAAGAASALPRLPAGSGRALAAWIFAAYGTQVLLFAGGLLAAVFARRPRREAVVRLSVALAAVAWVAQVVGQAWLPAAGGRPGPSPASLGYALLLPCLLLPWTLRESLAAAGALVATAWAAAVWDAAAGRAGWPAAGVAAVVSAAAAVPGCAVGWWRHSRFRGQYRLRFESEAYHRLRGELEGARRVHEACLPPTRRDGPVAVGYAYEPMQQIGGDLVFVHPPAGAGGPEGSGGPVSVVVLDVTGHGIAAALAVNRLYGELRRVFGEDPAVGPGTVLAALNRYVYLTLADLQVHATALCLRADPAAGTLRWASGGHPTAFLVRAPGAGAGPSIPTDLESTAMLLGAADGDDYDPDPAEVAFAAGDAVVAYTDGAAEAADGAGSMLGTAGVRRLAAAVAAGGGQPLDWPAELLARVAAHRDGPPADDTLVVVVAAATAADAGVGCPADGPPDT